MMSLPDIFTAGWTDALVNHLLQSTAIALLAWLLTLAMRANGAHIRYAIWMAASIKFLVPFSFMTRIGEHWATPSLSSHGAPGVYSVIEEFSQPFRLAQPGAHAAVPHSFAPMPYSITCALIAGV